MKATLERTAIVRYLIWITNKTCFLPTPFISRYHCLPFTCVCTTNGGWQFFSQQKKNIYSMDKNSFLIVCRDIHQKFIPKILFISLRQLVIRRWLWARFMVVSYPMSMLSNIHRKEEENLFEKLFFPLSHSGCKSYF